MVAWAQGPAQEVFPGDIIWFESGEKHWHGASPTVGASHTALVEAHDGKTTDWLEPVTHGQYTTR